MSLKLKLFHKLQKRPFVFKLNCYLDELIGNKSCGFTFPDAILIPPGYHTGVGIFFHSDTSIVNDGFAVTVGFGINNSTSVSSSDKHLS